MNLNVVHRLRHGHWYESRFVPISDYLSWRVCGRCQDEKARADHARMLMRQTERLAAGVSTPNYTQILRPWTLDRDKDGL